MSVSVREGIAKQISELAKEYPGLAKARDNLFVLWFLQAYVLGEEASDIDQYVCGFRGDGGIDAIFIDGQARMVHLVQGKLRQTFGSAEPSQDIDRFVRDCAIICSGDREKLNALLSRVNALSKEKLKQAAKRIASDGYESRLYYVTTGKVSKQKGDRFRSDVRAHIKNGIIDIVGSDELEYVYPDFRDGIAPPVPLTALDVEAGSTIIDRVDSASRIRSWIFPAEARSVSALYELCGTRLFAKNIRGYLGESTSINKAMAQTLRERPDEFFYLNNGITIICSRAEYIRGDANKIQLSNAQVINGQQTVRTISEQGTKPKATVLVKVMQVPQDNYSDFVSRVVQATNWQNAIKHSDLIANDERQIHLQKELRKLRYQYIRKRQSKSEARREAGRTTKQIKRDELAQAVAACELDPREIRSGVEHLFEMHYKALFHHSDPYFYLVRWWLRRAATVRARGDSDRGYAKWLVMSAMWGHLAPLLGTRVNRRAFVAECQLESGKLWEALCKAVDKMYIVAHQFYVAANRKRQEGERLDISRFYRDVKDLHTAFAPYWRSSANKQRKQFSKQLKVVQKELDVALAE